MTTILWPDNLEKVKGSLFMNSTITTLMEIWTYPKEMSKTEKV